jgi:polysaccharide deacetylase 2 family uncharacterized protein YibQ
MDRRSFLTKSALLMAGYFLNAGLFSVGHASEELPGYLLSKPRIALIIDDIGNSLTQAHRFLRLNIPITFSVLPRLRYSYLLAKEIQKDGHDVMLHQPMEPYNAHLDPGPGALYVGDEAMTIGRIIDDNVSDVPYAIGVNNHMGSRFTECTSEITDTLRIIKEKELFFIDSLTSNHSKAYRTARRLNMTAARRNIFLDNSRDESTIMLQLHRLKQCAREHGYAIGIGHPYGVTTRAIGDFINRFDHSDISFVHISDILYS